MTLPLPSPSSPLRIVVRFGWRYKAAREIARGVMRYASTHPYLQFEFGGVHEGAGVNDNYRRWRPDGIIGDAHGVTGVSANFTVPEALHVVRRTYPTCRAVVFMHTSPPLDGPRGIDVGAVLCDHRAVVRAAADLFLRRGLRHFGYVGTRVEERHYNERGALFAEVAREAGVPVSVYRPAAGNRDWNAEVRRLAKWLQALPKPCGVMAPFDARAKQVLDVCRIAGIAVPEQVQVCGVDNEEWICEQTLPSLTSIELDFDRAGYLAAETLDAMLRNEPSFKTGVVRSYGVRGVVERLSTQDAKGTARLVQRAQEFIRVHAASQISVADVVKAAGCSPSLLQRSFRTVLGMTPVRALQEARLDRARDLLERTTTPISDIARLCGLESEGHLKVLFRRRFGCSMREWRHNGSLRGDRP